MAKHDENTSPQLEPTLEEAQQPDPAAQAAVEQEQERFREAMMVAQAQYFERRTYELAIALATSA